MAAMRPRSSRATTPVGSDDITIDHPLVKGAHHEVLHQPYLVALSKSIRATDGLGLCLLRWCRLEEVHIPAGAVKIEPHAGDEVGGYEDDGARGAVIAVNEHSSTSVRAGRLRRSLKRHAWLVFFGDGVSFPEHDGSVITLCLSVRKSDYLLIFLCMFAVENLRYQFQSIVDGRVILFQGALAFP